MKKQLKMVALLLAASLLLSGCSLLTLEELYCPPKRSEDQDNLQNIIDKAMRNLTYSAPIAGDNQQAVQKADLDGDGVEEYLLFAKDSSDMPLKILIFCQLASGYVLMDTIEGFGFAFESVEYAQMDDKEGLEIVVSRQVSEDLPRSVSVYRFFSGFSRQLLSVSCNRMLLEDLNGDGISELLLLSSGESAWGQGALMRYDYDADSKMLYRDSVVNVPHAASTARRMEMGVLQDGTQAIFLSSAAEDSQLVVDVFVLENDQLVNMSDGIRIPTIYNYPVFPADIDSDGVMELAEAIPLQKYPDGGREQYILRWYSLDTRANRTDKSETYHQFAQGWYLNLADGWSESLAVQQTEEYCMFYMRNAETGVLDAVFMITALTDSDREEQAEQSGGIVLYRGESVIYVAKLQKQAMRHRITAQQIKDRFCYIRMEINNNESGE